MFDVTLEGRTTPLTLATTTALLAGMDVRAGVASPTRRARPARHPGQVRAVPAGGLLLQDLHLAELACLRAAHPRKWRGSAGSTPSIARRRIRRRSTRIATCWWSAPAPPASRPPAPPRGAGRSVMLVDDQPNPGGALRHRAARIEGVEGAIWAAQVVAELEGQGARVLADATAYGVYQHNLVAVWQRRAGAPDALWRVRAGEIVVAAGAIERPLAFPDNDRPGVMSAEAALIYLRRYDVRVGERVVVATNNSGAYTVADALRHAGAEVDHRRCQAGRDASTRVHGRTVEAVTISGTARRGRRAAGLRRPYARPSILHAHAQGKLRYDEKLAALVPAAPVAGLSVDRRRQRRVRSRSRAGARGRACLTRRRRRRRDRRAAFTRSRPPGRSPAPKGRHWIDYQNDVTLKDVELAARENFRLRRASQALHHARHGERSGQDLQPQRPRRDRRRHRAQHRGDRRHHLSPALRRPCR